MLVAAGAVVLALGARTFVQAGYWRDSLTLFRRAIDVTGPNALARTNLGAALAEAGRTQEALFAFLHVDTLYSSDGDAHAEALYHLVQVWQDLKNFARMQETRRILEDQYKESRWCKALEK